MSAAVMTIPGTSSLFDARQLPVVALSGFDAEHRATPEQLAERDRRLMETAAQCRAHALVLRSIATGGDLGGSSNR